MERISFRSVSKAYRLGENRTSLREALSSLGRRMMGRGNNGNGQILWALKDVCFDVGQGEVLGVIGPNGAGKTTILKLVSRITHPTSGQVHARGRVSALIELGAGFHPDLTGRENIFLNAAILGMSFKEAKHRLDDIVQFAGLEGFIDTPVKRYSSGMYVRLAFSVAAHVHTDILLVDEVLAVGDAQFGQRCLQRIREMRKAGVAILFVSHNLYLVESICDRCLLLAGGEVRSEGDVPTVLKAYVTWRQQEAELAPAHGRPFLQSESSPLEITEVEIQGSAGLPPDTLRHDQPAEILVHYRTARPIRRPSLYLRIHGKEGTCCMVRTSDYGIVLDDLSGTGCIRVAFDLLQLTPGTYGIHAELLEGADMVVLAEGFSASFRVPGNEVGREGVFVPRVGEARVHHGRGEAISHFSE